MQTYAWPVAKCIKNIEIHDIWIQLPQNHTALAFAFIGMLDGGHRVIWILPVFLVHLVQKVVLHQFSWVAFPWQFSQMESIVHILHN